MAQFRGEVEGNRGPASRLGSKKSGIRTTAHGWHSGVKVYASHIDGADVFDIYATGGSNGSTPTRLIAQIQGSGVIEQYRPDGSLLEIPKGDKVKIHVRGGVVTQVEGTNDYEVIDHDDREAEAEAQR